MGFASRALGPFRAGCWVAGANDTQALRALRTAKLAVTVSLKDRSADGFGSRLSDPERSLKTRTTDQCQSPVVETRQFGNGSFGVSIVNLFNRRLYGHSTGDRFVPLQPRRSLSVMLAFKG